MKAIIIRQLGATLHHTLIQNFPLIYMYEKKKLNYFWLLVSISHNNLGSVPLQLTSIPFFVIV